MTQFKVYLDKECKNRLGLPYEVIVDELHLIYPGFVSSNGWHIPIDKIIGVKEV